MVPKTDSLVDELYRVEGKAEIVDGRIVRMNAAGGWHGWVGLAIAASLIKCYRAKSPDEPQVFRPGDHADAEPAVKRWRFAVKKLVRG